ncbi:uncharacterized protein [Primulina eburnea]|uniref:uncharacterized protein n=1 Tax=Primulina eburnea TaxID=1245227 RepID=UPI003C6C9938
MAAPRTREQAALRMRQLTIDNPPPPPPPRVNLSQEDMMAIATTVAATLQGFVNPLANAIQPPQEPQPRGIKYHYESLRRNRVPTFDGNPDPEVSHNWLKNVETQLYLLEIPEELRVEVVTPFLEDRARKWWETVSPSLAEVEEITWQIFKREFLTQYYPAEFRLQKLNEFENFRQSPDMTVMEYTSKFNDLGTYVPTIMLDETLKMHRFKKGLNSRIQSAMAVYKPSIFADLMGTAMSAETDIKRREEENKNKRPMNNQSTQNNLKFKKPNFSGGSFKGSSGSTGDTEGKCYHPRKANKVADALSRKNPGKVSLSSLSVQPGLQETIKLKQSQDTNISKIKEQIQERNIPEFQIDKDGILWMKGRLYVPNIDGIREEVMAEAHKSRFSVHPGSTKMYRDLKNNYLWNGMKRDVAVFVAKCLTCQQVKSEHQRPG